VRKTALREIRILK
jgi:serine/threonine protein kinase